MNEQTAIVFRTAETQILYPGIEESTIRDDGDLVIKRLNEYGELEVVGWWRAGRWDGISIYPTKEISSITPARDQQK